MQEEFLYFPKERFNNDKIYSRILIISILAMIILSLSQLAHEMQPLTFFCLVAVCATPYLYIGYCLGLKIWLKTFIAQELGTEFKSMQNLERPKRESAALAFTQRLNEDPLFETPYLIGFSNITGRSLWLEPDSCKLGISVFSRDNSSSHQFGLSLLLQHLLKAGSSGALIIDLCARPALSSSLNNILKLCGREHDLIKATPEDNTHFINPFSFNYSTEEKAKKLILLASLVLNNSASGKTLGSESERFFFRLSRCLDNYGEEWGIREVIELINNFAQVSIRLRRKFEEEKFEQSIQDLSELESLMQKSSNKSQVEIRDILKVLCLALEDLGSSGPGSILSTGGQIFDFNTIISEGKVVYFSSSTFTDSNNSQALTALFLEEAALLCKSPAFNQTPHKSPPLILLLTESKTRIPLWSALHTISHSDTCSLICCSSDWAAEFKEEERTLANKAFINLWELSHFRIEFNVNFIATSAINSQEWSYNKGEKFDYSEQKILAKITSPYGTIPSFYATKACFD